MAIAKVFLHLRLRFLPFSNLSLNVLAAELLYAVRASHSVIVSTLFPFSLARIAHDKDYRKTLGKRRWGVY